MEGVSGIIVAGGAGRRLGRDKATLELAGVLVIQRVAERLAPVADELLVVLRAGQAAPPLRCDIPIRFLADVYPGVGALGGVYTGLAGASQPRCLAVACDMPFLSTALLRHLAGLDGSVDAVVPRVGGREEPLHAVYGRACLEPMRRLIEAGSLSMGDLLRAVRVRYVGEEEIAPFDPEGLSFFNLNSAADLARAERLLRG